MKRSQQLTWLFVTLICASAAIAQDASDVEMNSNGVYSGGKIDSIDLATGNLYLNIPLMSFPQLGKLPPLTFSISLNNAPYSQTDESCDPDTDICTFFSARYDTAPPGAPDPTSSEMLYQFPGETSPDGYTQEYSSYTRTIRNLGAYLTSSFGGGIVMGSLSQLGTIPFQTQAELDFSLVDPGGTTHVLESDAANPNVLRAPDGTGYMFLANTDDGASVYNPFDQGPLEWLSAPYTYYVPRLRSGTIVSPDGVRYTSAFISNPDLPPQSGTTPRILQTTASDRMNNTITRNGWYWGATIRPQAC